MRNDPAVVTFVKQIERYPCLWNYTLKDYNKREATDLAWKAIASEIGDTENNCRDRWKNVRCSFVRSHNSGKTKTRYYLADHLTFLLPYTKGKCGSDSQSIEYDDRKGVEDFVETTLDKSTELEIENALTGRCTSIDDVDQCDSSVSSPSPLPIERERSSRKRRFITQTTVNHKTDSQFKQLESSISNCAYDGNDADLLFFRSMMPDIKKLSDKQKRVFKRKIMTLLEDLLDEI